MKKTETGKKVLDICSKLTALYERLSKDDKQNDDSVSIANQKKMLEDYAKKNGFKNIKHFYDDGFDSAKGFSIMSLFWDLINEWFVADTSAKIKAVFKSMMEEGKAENREFTARKKAGLLTPEELKADEERRKHRREWQKQWRDSRKAAEKPKPAQDKKPAKRNRDTGDSPMAATAV